MERREAHERDIAQALANHNDEVHLHGETLPEQQQVYRVKVVTALLQAGIPLSKLEISLRKMPIVSLTVVTFDLVPAEIALGLFFLIALVLLKELPHIESNLTIPQLLLSAASAVKRVSHP